VSKKALAATILSAGFALALSACSEQSGVDLARQACGHVHQSIKAYEFAIHSQDAAVRASDFRRAAVELQEAEPLAASATSADGQWNALMTTLNEIGQVDEGHLIRALEAQCAVAESNQPAIPNLPTNITPGPLPSAPTSATGSP